MPAAEDAVVHLFRALKARARHVLVALRDSSGVTDECAAEWARTHRIFSARVVDYAGRLLGYWRDHPRSGSRLDIVFLPIDTIIMRRFSDEERRWLSFTTTVDGQCWYLPDPSQQSRRQWLERAEEIYREREVIIYGEGPRPRPSPTRRDEMPRHCEWFVRVQVLKMNWTDTMRTAGISDRKSVKEAVKLVADRLGVTLRTLRTGRPSKGPPKK